MSVINSLMMDNPLAALLSDSKNCHVGYVYLANFKKAFVLTNDAWKEQVRGIPHNCFLIAAAFNPENFSQTLEIDKEAVLLRVLDQASLPQDAELMKTRVEHNQRRTADEIHPTTHHDGLDPITQSELQYGGLQCRILGTFYLRGGQLCFGGDVENFMSSTRWRVFKPHKTALESIVNHINPEVKSKSLDEAIKSGFQSLPSAIDIGTIRYTSTTRLHRRNVDDLVPVQIQPSDFLGRRTAVLGMTRTGKSNTVKTTVAAVGIAARKDKLKVGQIIFDINGEYANANHQDDGSSIAEVFGNQCVRYRAIGMPENSGFRDLRVNFYDEPGPAINLLSKLSEVDPYRSTSTDTSQFFGTSLEEPDKTDIAEHTKWKRYVAAFHCLLHKAGYALPKNFKAYVPVAKDVLDTVMQGESAMSLACGRGYFTTDIDTACAWFLKARKVHYELKLNDDIGLKSSSSSKPWVDETLESFLNMLAQKNDRGNTIRGYRAIVPYREYHSAQRQGDVISEITALLAEGKIVILDLSVGPVEMRTVLSERIAQRIFNQAFDVMNKGETPQNIVIYVEEAHNIIGKKDDLTKTWPRIAKEGAKAKIAFVYATQEPSSLHPNILANTENWFVTHLNNDDELRTLGKFYDFADFTDSLKVAQDVGFARIKTLSSPFVVPTQINKFSPNELKQVLNAL